MVLASSNSFATLVAIRFFVGLALGDFAFEVDATGAVAVTQLRHRDHVDRGVQCAIAAPRQAMRDPSPGGVLDRCRAVVGGVVISVAEASDVTAVTDQRRRDDRADAEQISQ